jgi:hypothetical protein
VLRSRLLADVALVLLLVAVLVGALAVAQGFTLRDTPTTTSPAEVADLRVFAVVDELAGGPEGSATPTVSLDPLAGELGWDLTFLRVPGTGYTAAPAGQPNIAGLLEKQLTSSEYDLVLIQAGAADYTSGAGKTGAAAIGVVQRIREVVPLSTQIVLVGPLRAGPAVESAPSVQEVLAAVAERERVRFLDPVAEEWIVRADSAAGTDPLTQADLRQAARRLGEELKRAGLAR